MSSAAEMIRKWREGKPAPPSERSQVPRPKLWWIDKDNDNDGYNDEALEQPRGAPSASPIRQTSRHNEILERLRKPTDYMSSAAEKRFARPDRSLDVDDLIAAEIRDLERDMKVDSRVAASGRISLGSFDPRSGASLRISNDFDEPAYRYGGAEGGGFARLPPRKDLLRMSGTSDFLRSSVETLGSTGFRSLLTSDMRLEPAAKLDNPNPNSKPPDAAQKDDEAARTTDGDLQLVNSSLEELLKHLAEQGVAINSHQTEEQKHAPGGTADSILHITNRLHADMLCFKASFGVDMVTGQPLPDKEREERDAHMKEEGRKEALRKQLEDGLFFGDYIYSNGAPLATFGPGAPLVQLPPSSGFVNNAPSTVSAVGGGGGVALRRSNELDIVQAAVDVELSSAGSTLQRMRQLHVNIDAASLPAGNQLKSEGQSVGGGNTGGAVAQQAYDRMQILHQGLGERMRQLDAMHQAAMRDTASLPPYPVDTTTGYPNSAASSSSSSSSQSPPPLPTGTLREQQALPPTGVSVSHRVPHYDYNYDAALAAAGVADGRLWVDGQLASGALGRGPVRLLPVHRGGPIPAALQGYYGPAVGGAYAGNPLLPQSQGGGNNPNGTQGGGGVAGANFTPEPELVHSTLVSASKGIKTNLDAAMEALNIRLPEPKPEPKPPAPFTDPIVTAATSTPVAHIPSTTTSSDPFQAEPSNSTRTIYPTAAVSSSSVPPHEVPVPPAPPLSPQRVAASHFVAEVLEAVAPGVMSAIPTAPTVITQTTATPHETLPLVVASAPPATASKENVQPSNTSAVASSAAPTPTPTPNLDYDAVKAKLAAIDKVLGPEPIKPGSHPLVSPVTGYGSGFDKFIPEDRRVERDILAAREAATTTTAQSATASAPPLVGGGGSRDGMMYYRDASNHMVREPLRELEARGMLLGSSNRLPSSSTRPRVTIVAPTDADYSRALGGGSSSSSNSSPSAPPLPMSFGNTHHPTAASASAAATDGSRSLARNYITRTMERQTDPVVLDSLLGTLPNYSNNRFPSSNSGSGVDGGGRSVRSYLDREELFAHVRGDDGTSMFRRPSEGLAAQSLRRGYEPGASSFTPYKYKYSQEEPYDYPQPPAAAAAYGSTAPSSSSGILGGRGGGSFESTASPSSTPQYRYPMADRLFADFKPAQVVHGNNYNSSSGTTTTVPYDHGVYHTFTGTAGAGSSGGFSPGRILSSSSFLRGGSSGLSSFQPSQPPPSAGTRSSPGSGTTSAARAGMAPAANPGFFSSSPSSSSSSPSSSGSLNERKDYLRKMQHLRQQMLSM